MLARWFLAAVCGCTSILPASAATVTYTYGGTVGYGFDRAGLFGAGPDLTGLGFRLVETFETGVAAYRAVEAARSLQFGGTRWQAPNAATLQVTIGGGLRHVTDVTDFVSNDAATGQHLDFVQDPASQEYAGVSIRSALIPADYGTTIHLTTTDATFEGLYQFVDAADPNRATFARFAVASLQVSGGTLAPVPLPGTLALFGAGLVGLAGIGLRRRRRV